MLPPLNHYTWDPEPRSGARGPPDRHPSRRPGSQDRVAAALAHAVRGGAPGSVEDARVQREGGGTRGDLCRGRPDSDAILRRERGASKFRPDRLDRGLVGLSSPVPRRSRLPVAYRQRCSSRFISSSERRASCGYGIPTWHSSFRTSCSVNSTTGSGAPYDEQAIPS